MNIKELIADMSIEEKALLVTGAGSMNTASCKRLGIDEKLLSDGTAGVRTDAKENRICFPSVSCLASSWDKEAAFALGSATAEECADAGVSMILSPGMNIKRNALCGRNFEYFSEDPILTGEMAAAFVNGAKAKGVATCPKHYAVNSQEKNRLDISAEVDERTLREIYLRGFEICVKKSAPDAIMCAYNKVNSVWCSENRHLLTDILKKDFGFEGAVISDWGAVHDICRCLTAGLDLQMPANGNIVAEIKAGLADGCLTEEALNGAVERVLRFLVRPKPEKSASYNRKALCDTARTVAAAGNVLLKNENETLPLTEAKYKKILVAGEFAVSPLIQGQGSAEINQENQALVESPLEELKKLLPHCEFEYVKAFEKTSFSPTMLWPTVWDFRQKASEADAVIIFAGVMESEDTENFDRRTLLLNPNYEMFIEGACKKNDKTVVVLQAGGAVTLGDYVKNHAAAILYMGLGGETAGGAVAQVLCGKINPSGRLTETFPVKERTDLDYPGNGLVCEYNEKWAVGYRYYDRRPELVQFPFGHGLSYTDFAYSDLTLQTGKEAVSVSFTLANTGKYDGAEVWQVYISDPFCTLSVPEKELKQFGKLYLKKGERKSVSLQLPFSDFAHFNTSLGQWVVEDGRFDVIIASSCTDIRLKKSIVLSGFAPYTMTHRQEPMIG